MERDKALSLVEENIDASNLIKHCLAVEAVMKKLATHFDKDVKKWRLAGLLHDIDYEETKDDPEKHSIIGAKMLKDLGLDEEIVQAVKTHNDAHGIEPQGLMGKALYCVDPLTGLIVAAALISPSKKINDIDTDFVMRRFEEKRFAEGADRDVIKKCEEYLDLELKEFIAIALEAMQKINKDLGL